jgi:2Fe-2S ferredoxin
MVSITVVRRNGQEAVVDGPAGYSLMEAIRDSGIDEILALCGGSRSCATCHVFIDEPFLSRLPEMSEEESDLLDGSDHRGPSSRLSCQIPCAPELDGLRAQIAPED